MQLTRPLYFGDFIAAPFAIASLAILALLPGHVAASRLLFWLSALIVGGATWTLVEYVVHRWIYHRIPTFEKFHDEHHAAPRELIGAPSFVSIGLILVLIFVPLLAVGLTFASGFTSGMLVGYVGYIFVHHATHHWACRPGTLLYHARVRHMVHHYHARPGNFGVTTSFWDRIFASYIEPARAR
jgi:sterol desaturase/sphingolipid hydroxylase (fatty acid hydroxylase superfamily)